MMDQQINTVIAKACGRAMRPDGYWFPEGSKIGSQGIPNYANDLNAMHEAEKVLENPDLYEEWLESICNGKSYLFHATARQRAEAFLRTIGKWEEL